MDQTLCAAFLSKIDEQIERTDHLIRALRHDRLDWKPGIPDAFSATVLLGHLLECLAGFCAVLQAAAPERLRSFDALRGLPVNHRCTPAEARQRIETYRARIREGFAVLQDRDLGRAVPTVFVPEGEPVLTLLLGNLEHLINHKHQLFMYLRLMGVDVDTRDLYRFRGQ
jgi:hypothetical protein